MKQVLLNTLVLKITTGWLISLSGADRLRMVCSRSILPVLHAQLTPPITMMQGGRSSSPWRLYLLPTTPACRLCVFLLARLLIAAKRQNSEFIRSEILVSYVMWAIRALAATGLSARIALAADFDWSAIEPSEQLKYHPCDDGLQCARLSVPYGSC